MWKENRLLFVALLLCALSVGIVIGTLIDGDVRAVPRVLAPDASPLVIPDPVLLSNAFSQLAQRLEPAVVNITTSKGGGASNSKRAPQEEGGNDSMRRFFDNPFGGQESPFRSNNIGSGVVVDKNGYILTNWHVVEDADEILVKIHGDRKNYPAKLVGSDWETDLAVLKIDAGRTIESAPVGNSDGVQVGDWVVAIGSPFGLEATVTAGIVSAKQRELADAQAFQRFLQTDAAINPGNSGGPLLNIRGEVIGINTAIASNSGRYQGVGFALPMNTAVSVYNQIVRQGKVTRGSIGISLNREDDPEALRAYGVMSGVIVAGITTGGPAQRGGLKVDDVIVSVDGKPVKNGTELIERVAALPVGAEVPVEYFRGGRRMANQVLIGDRAQVLAAGGNGRRIPGGVEPETPEEKESVPGEVSLGLSVQNIDAATLKEWNFPAPSGVLISKVEGGSFASNVGLRTGDVIVSAGGREMKSMEDVLRFREGLKSGDAVAFRVFRKLGNPRPGVTSWSPFFAAGTLP
ncbi:MAG: trypsin-like peptidase domain-containing protein [Bryobacterales bacterium]|nr:trypsin-like peptidase domain-containing protein [Bryobacterales bacterium]